MVTKNVSAMSFKVATNADAIQKWGIRSTEP